MLPFFQQRSLSLSLTKKLIFHSFNNNSPLSLSLTHTKKKKNPFFRFILSSLDPLLQLFQQQQVSFFDPFIPQQQSPLSQKTHLSTIPSTTTTTLSFIYSLGVKLFKFKCRTQTAIFKQIKNDENLGPVLANRTVKALIDKYGKWVKDGSQPSLTKGGCPVVEKTGGAEEDSRQKTVGAEEERGVAGIATALDDLIDCLGETTEKLKKIRENLLKKM